MSIFQHQLGVVSFILFFYYCVHLSFDGQLSVSAGHFCPAQVLCYWCVVTSCWQIKNTYIHTYIHVKISSYKRATLLWASGNHKLALGFIVSTKNWLDGLPRLLSISVATEFDTWQLLTVKTLRSATTTRLSEPFINTAFPSDLLLSSRWCLAIPRLEACSKSTSHHLDPSDLPGHRNSGDRLPGAGRRQIVLATNRNGGMLRLNASRHDDDDDG